MGRDQDGLHGELDAPLEPVAVLQGQVDEADQAVDLARCGRAAEGSGGELLEDLAGDLAAVGRARPLEDDPLVRLGQVVGQAVHRADDLDPVDRQVAVALPGVGDVGIPGVVGEGGGEPADRHLDLDLRLVDRRRVLLGLDLEGSGGLAVDQEFELRQVLARLLTEGPGPEDVIARLGEGVVDAHLIIAGHQPEAGLAVDAAGARLGDGLGLEPAGRPSGLVVGEDRHVGDRLGGGEVLLHQERRQREDVADVVEAVADVVRGEVVGRPEVDPDEVADRVVVLLAIEPTERDPAGILDRLAARLRDQAFEVLDEPGRFRLRGLRLVVRGHLPLSDGLKDLLPGLEILQGGGLGAEGGEVQAALGLLGAVAAHAIPGQHGRDLGGISRRPGATLGACARAMPAGNEADHATRTVGRIVFDLIASSASFSKAGGRCGGLRHASLFHHSRSMRAAQQENGVAMDSGIAEAVAPGIAEAAWPG